jgi:hypothetical protein
MFECFRSIDTVIELGNELKNTISVMLLISNAFLFYRDLLEIKS